MGSSLVPGIIKGASSRSAFFIGSAPYFIRVSAFFRTSQKMKTYQALHPFSLILTLTMRSKCGHNAVIRTLESFMGVRIRIRRGVVHLVIVTGGKRHEETTGLHISSNSTQNKEVMRMAEVLRSRREIQIIEGLNGISLGHSSAHPPYPYC